MLKETETEETIGFCHICIIGGISIGGGRLRLCIYVQQLIASNFA